ncbi:MAG TPA: ATP-binding protein [Burkholderiales bacterium]|nr:ATP-binding protein [Burkholderiales bacterium]
MIRGDLLRFTQLLTNLVNNAAHHTRDGGSIDISARYSASGRTGALRDRQGSDTGQGIDAHLKECIFQMFLRAMWPLERMGSGLGIGLALAGRLAEMHDGDLQATSGDAGRGSEVTVRLRLSSRCLPSPPTFTLRWYCRISACPEWMHTRLSGNCDYSPTANYASLPSWVGVRIPIAADRARPIRPASCATGGGRRFAARD